jgi:acetyltransferase
MDAGFSETAISLRDGRRVHIRAMRRTDADEFVQAFSRMSEDARYMRFMRLVREPNRERLGKVLASFPAAGAGIVATVPAVDGFDIVGSAVYLLDDQRTSGEFAISVAAEFGGAGLASALLKILVDSAKARGLEELMGFVLAANQPMLRLAHRRGFSVAPDPDDIGHRICRLRLRDA